MPRASPNLPHSPPGVSGLMVGDVVAGSTGLQVPTDGYLDNGAWTWQDRAAHIQWEWAQAARESARYDAAAAGAVRPHRSVAHRLARAQRDGSRVRLPGADQPTRPRHPESDDTGARRRHRHSELQGRPTRGGQCHRYRAVVRRLPVRHGLGHGGDDLGPIPDHHSGGAHVCTGRCGVRQPARSATGRRRDRREQRPGHAERYRAGARSSGGREERECRRRLRSDHRADRRVHLQRAGPRCHRSDRGLLERARRRALAQTHPRRPRTATAPGCSGSRARCRARARRPEASWMRASRRPARACQPPSGLRWGMVSR